MYIAIAMPTAITIAATKLITSTRLPPPLAGSGVCGRDCGVGVRETAGIAGGDVIDWLYSIEIDGNDSYGCGVGAREIAGCGVGVRETAGGGGNGTPLCCDGIGSLIGGGVEARGGAGARMPVIVRGSASGEGESRGGGVSARGAGVSARGGGRVRISSDGTSRTVL